MLNKSVMAGKPLAVLGDFWSPIIECVRQVELGHNSPWGEANGRLIYVAATPKDAARHLKEILQEKERWHERRKTFCNLTSCGRFCGCHRSVCLGCAPLI